MMLTYFNLLNILLLISSVIVSHSALYTKPFYTEYFQYASIFFYTRDQASTTKKNKLDAFYTKLCDVLPDDEPTRFETLGVSLF